MWPKGLARLIAGVWLGGGRRKAMADYSLGASDSARTDEAGFNSFALSVDDKSEPRHRDPPNICAWLGQAIRQAWNVSRAIGDPWFEPIEKAALDLNLMREIPTSGALRPSRAFGRNCFGISSRTSALFIEKSGEACRTRFGRSGKSNCSAVAQATGLGIWIDRSVTLTWKSKRGSDGSLTGHAGP